MLFLFLIWLCSAALAELDHASRPTSIPFSQKAAVIRWCCARFDFMIICAKQANQLQPLPATPAPQPPRSFPAPDLASSNLPEKATAVRTASHLLLESLMSLELAIPSGQSDPTKGAEEDSGNTFTVPRLKYLYVCETGWACFVRVRFRLHWYLNSAFLIYHFYLW